MKRGGNLFALLWLLGTLTTLTVGNAPCSSMTSANSVSSLFDLSSVVPQPVNCGPGLSCDFYLGSSSCLGALGPLGAYGPLGTLGPLGNNSWNPSTWFGALGDWSEFAKEITGLGGPLGESGPLGENGPVSVYWYTEVMPKINDFALHLAAEGLWSVLGPIGPLGCLGPLGPLGPIGATGYRTDAQGNFYDSNNNIVRQITTQYNNTFSRTYGLYEMYTEQRAKQLGWSQDTSFMALGEIQNDEADVYHFTSSVAQYVTIVVTPKYQLDAYDILLTDSNGNFLASSNETIFINWVQVYVPAGKATFSATVTLGYSLGFWDHSYRLLVTGSTQYIPVSTEFSGPYISQCN